MSGYSVAKQVMVRNLKSVTTSLQDVHLRGGELEKEQSSDVFITTNREFHQNICCNTKVAKAEVGNSARTLVPHSVRRRRSLLLNNCFEAVPHFIYISYLTPQGFHLIYEHTLLYFKGQSVSL